MAARTHLRLVLVGPGLQRLGLVEQVLATRLALPAHAAKAEQVLLDAELLGYEETERENEKEC